MRELVEIAKNLLREWNELWSAIPARSTSVRLYQTVQRSKLAVAPAKSSMRMSFSPASKSCLACSLSPAAADHEAQVTRMATQSAPSCLRKTLGHRGVSSALLAGFAGERKVLVLPGIVRSPLREAY
jgi:hypothetical protein